MGRAVRIESIERTRQPIERRRILRTGSMQPSGVGLTATPSCRRKMRDKLRKGEGIKRLGESASLQKSPHLEDRDPLRQNPAPFAMASTEPTAPRYCFRCKVRTRHHQSILQKGSDTKTIRVICDRCGGLTATYADEEIGADSPAESVEDNPAERVRSGENK